MKKLKKRMNLEQRERKADIEEFDRMEKKILDGKTKMRRAKNVEEIFA